MGVLLFALYPNDNYSKDNHSYTSVQGRLQDLGKGGGGSG